MGWNGPGSTATGEAPCPGRPAEKAAAAWNQAVKLAPQTPSSGAAWPGPPGGGGPGRALEASRRPRAASRRPHCSWPWPTPTRPRATSGRRPNPGPGPAPGPGRPGPPAQGRPSAPRAGRSGGTPGALRAPAQAASRRRRPQFNLIALRAGWPPGRRPPQGGQVLDELANLAPDDQDIRHVLAALHGEMATARPSWRTTAAWRNWTPKIPTTLQPGGVASELNDPAQALAPWKRPTSSSPGTGNPGIHGGAPAQAQ